MVKALHGPFPNLAMMPTGGVSLANITDWFEAGVMLVGAGSNLVDGASQGDYEKVTVIAQQYRAKIAQIKDTRR